MTRRCSLHHCEGPGARLRWCKHPTLSCDLLLQRLREGCLLELAGSDTLARSEPSERSRGPEVTGHRFIKSVIPNSTETAVKTPRALPFVSVYSSGKFKINIDINEADVK